MDAGGHFDGIENLMPVALAQPPMSASTPGQSLVSFSTSPDCMPLSSFFASTIGPGQVAPRMSSATCADREFLRGFALLDE